MPTKRTKPTRRSAPSGRRADAPLADALVHVQPGYTSWSLLASVGSISRDRMLPGALCPLVKHAVMVTYGGVSEAEYVLATPPAGWKGTISCIGNDAGLEPAIFQSRVPQRVFEALEKSRARSALVYADQHHGAEVALQAAELLRARGLRVGLVARCGYHWSWTVARDTAPNDPRAIAAATLEGNLCRRADLVIATTRRIADNLAWQHHLDPARIRVVPNFVVPEGAPPPMAKRTPGTILFAGRLEPEKRVDLLIRAIAMAAKSNPLIHLIVIGDGSQLAALKRLAKSYRAPVEFRSRLPHSALLREMGRCNVYAQPSRFEGHPKTVLEAMAMGAPTLVTRAPGVDDEINPNVTGIVCGDAEADLTAALVWLVANPPIAARLGARAARDIRARLSFNTVLPKAIECLRHAMTIAGSSASAREPAPPVRWEQTLLNAGPDAAASEFCSSIGAYAKRLDPRIRPIFMDGVAARLGPLAEIRAAPHALAKPAPRARAPRR